MIRFISGVPPSLSIGAGRFIFQLEETFAVAYFGNKSAAGEAYRRKRYLRFAFEAALHYVRRARLAVAIKTNAFARTSDTLVVYHPQELGWESALKIIEASPRMVWIYVLDMGIFCIRSYNYIPGETQACFRCLGGQFENAERMNCRSFPVEMDFPVAALERLRAFAAKRKVGFLLQAGSQEAFLRKHFGPDVAMKHVGLWTVDFEADLTSPIDKDPTKASPYDVVFHGSDQPAKGFQWALEVAKLAPDLRFLFPMTLPPGLFPPENCAFSPLRWESGLREQALTAKLTLVPSLWSAVIEGALIKSVHLAPRTGIVDIEGSFGRELSEDIVLKLPSSPVEAAAKIRAALDSDWRPNPEKLAHWKRDFIAFNRALTERLGKEL